MNENGVYHRESVDFQDLDHMQDHQTNSNLMLVP